MISRSGVITRGWARWTARVVLIALAAGIPHSARGTLDPAAAENEAYRSVYFAALLSGRDPDAALRKAHFTAGYLVKQFGMTRTDAAAEVAKFMIWRTGSLCGGG
jgi:hypothetical protein